MTRNDLGSVDPVDLTVGDLLQMEELVSSFASIIPPDERSDRAINAQTLKFMLEGTENDRNAHPQDARHP